MLRKPTFQTRQPTEFASLKKHDVSEYHELQSESNSIQRLSHFYNPERGRRHAEAQLLIKCFYDVGIDVINFNPSLLETYYQPSTKTT